MKKKLFVIIGIALLIAVMVMMLLAYLFINYNTTTNYLTIGVSDAKLTESEFTAHLVTSSSGSKFQKYEYEIKDNSLYITVWSGLDNSKYSAEYSGEMDIKIEDNLSNVTSVYLNDKDDTKLIYSKK